MTVCHVLVTGHPLHVLSCILLECSQCLVAVAAGQTDGVHLPVDGTFTEVGLSYKDVHTMICQCVPHRQFYVADSPEGAVALCQWLHSEKVAGRIGYVHQGPKILGKDRQTVQQFKHVYYMFVKNKGLYEEVSTVVRRHALALNTQYYNDVLPIADGEAVAQWAKKELATLDSMCKSRIDADVLGGKEVEGEMTIFGCRPL